MFYEKMGIQTMKPLSNHNHTVRSSRGALRLLVHAKDQAIEDGCLDQFYEWIEDELPALELYAQTIGIKNIKQGIFTKTAKPK
jgi:hypothetical protein